MCEQCWNEMDKPTAWNPNIKRALELVRIIYETEAAGGPMHIVLDDWNIEDHDLECCRIESFQDPAAIAAMADGISSHAVEATIQLVPLMLRMPIEERAATLAYYDGFVAPPQDEAAETLFKANADCRFLLRLNTEQEEEIARLRARIAELEQAPKDGDR